MTTLAQWLERQERTAAWFGRKIGTRSRQTVWSWLLPASDPRHRKPSGRYLPIIARVTNGEVTADSFYNHPTPHEGPAAVVASGAAEIQSDAPAATGASA